MPGNRPDRFEKAWQSGADAVILDLEDAVRSTHKDLAREAVAAWLDPTRSVYIRINAACTPWFDHDLELVGLPGGPRRRPAEGGASRAGREAGRLPC